MKSVIRGGLASAGSWIKTCFNFFLHDSPKKMKMIMVPNKKINS
jgi:hypothetical protein